MHYDMPQRLSPSETPKAVFPWESYAPKPTRIFPTEHAASPFSPQAPPQASIPHSAVLNTGPAKSPIGSSLTTTGSTIVTFRDTWSNYERINTWDSVPEIEQYVQAFTQSNKAKVQVLHHNDTSMETPDVVSPSRGLGTRVTDFPSEVERPSLPVTPAPRRPGFWEAERDKDGELPAAAGVPQQEDWVSLILPAPSSFHNYTSVSPPTFFLEDAKIGRIEPSSKARGAAETPCRGLASWNCIAYGVSA